MVLVRRRSPWWAVAVAVVALLAIAALVVSTIALTRDPAVSPTATPSPTAAAPTTSATAPVNIDELDTALCEEIGPLMKESNDRSNAFVLTGEPGSTERNEAIPAFREATLDWAERTQAVLDDYAEPERFLTRTLQRFIDDMSLYVRNVRSGLSEPYDTALWTDATAAYGGPLSRCQEVGVLW